MSDEYVSPDHVVAEEPYWSRWIEWDEGMTLNEYRAIRQSIAVSWHAGWQPTEQDVRDMCNRAKEKRNARTKRVE